MFTHTNVLMHPCMHMCSYKHRRPKLSENALEHGLMAVYLYGLQAPPASSHLSQLPCSLRSSFSVFGLLASPSLTFPSTSCTPHQLLCVCSLPDPGLLLSKQWPVQLSASTCTLDPALYPPPWTAVE